MKGTEIISSARIATFDDKIGQETWKDDKYLKALNQARSYLFTNYPESRLNSAGVLQTFSDIAQKDLSDTMWESDIYFIFLAEYICYIFFGGSAGDTQNSRQASEHYTTAMRALDPRYRTASNLGR